MGRKKANIHYIYKTTCNVTGRWYIGMHSTCNLEDGYMGSGKRLRRSIRKYGKENHTKEILEYFDTREELVEAEKKAITEDMITDSNCMNLCVGGQGGFISKEGQKRGAIAGGKARALRMLVDENFRIKMNEISSVNLINFNNSGLRNHKSFKNKTHSEKSKQLMSDKAKKRTSEQNSQYGTCWITKDGENKKIKKEDLDLYQLDGWIKGRKTI